jgi:hypothetical protein
VRKRKEVCFKAKIEIAADLTVPDSDLRGVVGLGEVEGHRDSLLEIFKER